MSKPLKLTVKEFHDQLRSTVKEAHAKSASALKATDPNYQGTPEVPSFNTEKNRSNINLPKNPDNLHGPQDVDGTQGLCTITNPAGVGQGEYPTPINGNARDAAYVSPSTPISKIAGNLMASTADQFDMPSSIRNDVPLMQKLAFIGGNMLATKEGQNYVNSLLIKKAGRQEAQNILREVYSDMQKEAAANQYAISEQTCYANHAANLGIFDYQFEKNAYMQGAMDGEQTADAAAVGAGPEAAIAPEQGQISDEEVMSAIQALVESGQVSPQEAEAFIARVSGDQAPAYSGEEIAAMIAEDIQNGTISPEIGEVLAGELLQGIQSGQIPA